eukprot:m.562088 g.562088  ORF g.562088 m.562088 type:complete len:161 (-) comp22220_c0_seq3:2167-2649(-)
MSELHDCAERGDIEGLRRALRKDADPDEVDFSRSSRTALHIACSSGAADCVKELIANECDIRALTQPGGWTACHAAAEAGEEKCVQALLKADSGKKYFSSFIPSILLHQGLFYDLECTGIAVILDSSGDSPAVVARMYGHIGLAQLLESHEKSINTSHAK